MLALVGSGEYLAAMQPVDRALIETQPMETNVVCLPTAAGQEGSDRVQYWMDLGMSHFSRLGVKVSALPLINRSGAQNDGWVQAIRQANFVYLSGGNPNYLYNTLADTPAWDAILSVHQNGGIVAGCSAGAMIMGGHIPGRLHWNPAFGLLPNTVVIPHFDEIPSIFIGILRMFSSRSWMVIGIEGNTALVIDDKGWQVVGGGEVTTWQHGIRSRFIQGPVK